jgi:integrase
LVTGAFLTGARYGELAELRVEQFDGHRRTLRINVGKTGARTIVLQSAAADFLSRISDGRDPDDFLFIRSGGRRWKKSDQTRPIKDALRAAGLSTEGSLYALRHTYISRAKAECL